MVGAGRLPWGNRRGLARTVSAAGQGAAGAGLRLDAHGGSGVVIVSYAVLLAPPPAVTGISTSRAAA